MGQPGLELGMAVAATPVLVEPGLGTLHPQQRRGDGRPGGDGVRSAVGHRVDALVRRVGQQVPAAIGPRRRPMAGQPLRFVGRQPRVVLLQPLGHLVLAGVGHQALRRLQLVQPGGQALGRLGGRQVGQAEAFQVDQPADALRAHAGIGHHHVAAHAVAEQVDRRIGRQQVEQRVEVAHVVGKPVGIGAGRCGGQAEAAPVGGDDAARPDRVPVTGTRQCIHHELERRAHIHEAVGHHQQRLAGPGLAPLGEVDLQAAHGNLAAQGGAQRGVGGAHRHDCRPAAHRAAVGGATAGGTARLWRRRHGPADARITG